MYELKVDGMNCGGCAKGVTRAIQAADAHAQVEVDLKTKTVRVESRAELRFIEKAVSDAGYPVVGRTPV
ncbi:MAG: heavy-metal-associated domain-containing protein [Sideroxyarcus sp.]|nr:heavy-metal-associated domain-containing protein [Sideroxyarcus sp.]